VAERLRHAIADTGFPFEGRVVGLTASFGIADPGTAGTLEQALSQADTSLYAAKSEGRNRVAAASDRTARRTASVVKLVT
jgi:diguanylate cyclase (GGDEF)-like protein